MEQVTGDVADAKLLESVITADVHRCGNITLTHCFDAGMLNFMPSNSSLSSNKRGSNLCIGYTTWQRWLVQARRPITSWV